MGSFDVSCGISNIAINREDKAGFLILEKKPVYLKPDFPSPGKTLIINATDLYRPVLPAVYGEYDDYGRLVDIRESVTTKVIEAMFGRPVQQVIDCVVSSDDIYDMRSAIAEAYATNPKLVTDRSDSTEKYLTDLGFKVENQDGIDVYVFNRKHEIVAAAEDNCWTIRQCDSKKVIGNVSAYKDSWYLLNTFSYLTGTYPGFEPKDYRSIRSLNAYGGMFFMEEVFRGMDKFNAYEHYMNNYEMTRLKEFTEDWRESIKELIQALEDGDRFFSITNNIGMDMFFRDLAFPAHHFDFLPMYADAENEILELRSMLRISEEVNRPFSPSVYSNQGDSDRPAKMLNTIVAHVLGKREAQWNEDNLPPEDEDEPSAWDFPEYP